MIEILKISKESLENDCFIVKVGTNDRPATESDLDDVQKSLTDLVDTMELDKEPSILITHHCVSVESIDKETLKNLINRE
jgi:hypothetical protein